MLTLVFGTPKGPPKRFQRVPLSSKIFVRLNLVQLEKDILYCYYATYRCAIKCSFEISALGPDRDHGFW